MQFINNLSNVEFMKAEFLRYIGWQELLNKMSAEDSVLPKHLCEMLFNIKDNREAVFERFGKLPVVLCHRDYWVTNIFHTDETVFAIDWDTAGWGYLGEDISSLVADDADVTRMVEHFRICVPEYYRGFNEHARADVRNNRVYELILLMFAYRIAENHMGAKCLNEKRTHADTLQRIYEIGEIRL
jgi:thiamine kinase-like enzyme